MWTLWSRLSRYVEGVKSGCLGVISWEKEAIAMNTFCEMASIFLRDWNSAYVLKMRSHREPTLCCCKKQRYLFAMRLQCTSLRIKKSLPMIVISN